ncbi:putative galacturonosyltransferase 12 [Sesamum alatum]|uniref:Galacturonosyltransferase 12 n=1 Tax=Sesamum alatum TaxID=300844 RepID=A0AAE2CFW6_9LAMI|nr:putative galacturonosyltransferase 12 [Sesamum alatum]
MQLHISPSLRHVTVLPSKGFREFIKVKIGSRRLSYRMVFYSLLVLTFLLRFVFVLTAVDTIEGETRCSTIGCLGKKFGPRILGRRHESSVPEVIYQVLAEPVNQVNYYQDQKYPSDTGRFIAEMNGTNDLMPRPLQSSSNQWLPSLNKGQERQKYRNICIVMWPQVAYLSSCTVLL